jgi:hypothetical protein
LVVASLLVLPVVPNSVAVASLKKPPLEPSTVSKEVRAACDAAYAIGHGPHAFSDIAIGF